MKGSIFFSKMAGKGWVKTLILEALEGGRRNCARQISHLLRGHTFPTIGFLEAVLKLGQNEEILGAIFSQNSTSLHTLDTTEQKKLWFRKDQFPGFKAQFPIEKKGFFEASASPHPCYIWIRISQTKKHETLQCFRIISTYAMNQFNTHTNEQKTEGNLEGPDKLDMQRFCRLELFWWIGPSIQ